MDKLYGIKTDYGNYEIKEFEIIKETTKQYKVREIVKGMSNEFVYPYTINKDKMYIADYSFETTLEKAQFERKQLIQEAIQINKRRVEDYKKRIAVLEKLLTE